MSLYTKLLSLFSLLCMLASSCKEQPANLERTTPPINKRPVCDAPSYAGKLKVAVIIYDGVEVVDMNGPIDVFAKAGYVRDHYYVYTVAARDTTVYTENCYTAIKPRYTIYNCPSPDIIILPGCSPVRINELLADSAFTNNILEWIKKAGMNSETEIMAVCTGGLLLAKTGLLDGRIATTHYLALNEMRKLYPKVRVVSGVRYTDTLNTITTAGITSGIDGALHLVEKYEGSIIADSVAHIMVYNRSCPMRP